VQARALIQQRAGDPSGYVLTATALRRLGRLPELEAFLQLARQRFPNHPRLAALGSHAQPAPAPPAGQPATLLAAASAAFKRADWAELETLCASLRAADPAEPRAYLMGARALRELKRLRRADTLSKDGVARFPDHPKLLLERALILLRLKQFDQAAACYARLAQLQPELPLHVARGAEALILSARFDAAEAVIAQGLQRFPNDVEQLGALPEAPQTPAADPPNDPPAAAHPDAATLKQFEALGGNCEFGLVQRAAGIEPLGLLRFTGIDIDDLIALLQAGFAQLGDPAETELILNAQNEYMLVHRRYPSFRTHTFINLGDTDPIVLHAKLCKRTRFLRDKLLAELRAGAKIFLCRPADGRIDPGAIAELHDAFRTLGPGLLVVARNAPSHDPVVRVSPLEPGLMAATLPGHSHKLTLEYIQRHRYEHWLDLCRAVLAQAHRI
jgi:tetratricopeptide (TPR) repeat protein